jgi:DNA-binding phage protein
MLHTISWSSFVLVLVVILIAYYLFMLVAYFRKDILSISLINKKSLVGNNHNDRAIKSTGNPKEKSTIQTNNSGDQIFTIVYELLADFKDLFLLASETKMIREELIQAIRSKLKAYQTISETDLVEGINNHLIMEAKNSCALDLSPEDLKLIWSS